LAIGFLANSHSDFALWVGQHNTQMIMSGRGPNCFVGLHVVYSNTLRTSSSSSSTWSSWSSSSSLGSAGSAGQTKCVFNANMQQQQHQQLPLKLVDSWVDWE